MERSSTFWRGRNVLVTGCTGVVGSWLTEALAEAGAVVVGLIRDWVPQSHLVRSGTIDRIRVVRGEVEDYRFTLGVPTGVTLKDFPAAPVRLSCVMGVSSVSTCWRTIPP